MIKIVLCLKHVWLKFDNNPSEKLGVNIKKFRKARVLIENWLRCELYRIILFLTMRIFGKILPSNCRFALREPHSTVWIVLQVCFRDTAIHRLVGSFFPAKFIQNFRKLRKILCVNFSSSFSLISRRRTDFRF